MAKLKKLKTTIFPPLFLLLYPWSGMGKIRIQDKTCQIRNIDANRRQAVDP